MTTPTASAPISISLRRLFPGASFVGCGDIVAADATERSGDCRPGCLFAALPGTNAHGSAFVPEAVQRGAASILTDRPLPGVDLPQCILRDPRPAFARLCQTLRQWPSRRLGMTGITGTNGKTTTAWLVRSILAANGRTAGLLGTIEYHDGVETADAALTTPDSAVLAGWLASAVRRGTSHMALELSSHALVQGRAAGLELDVAVVTNITQDHFDYHRDFAAYRAAKREIARLLKRGGLLVLNADDPGSRSLLGEAAETAQCRTFGIEAPADIAASRLSESANGSRFTVVAGGESAEFETRLIGRHNIANCLAATAAGLHFGLSLQEIAAGIGALRCVLGRLQAIDCGQPFQVFVDYAHTEDALRRLISAVRPWTRGRVICLFGAGGDRDRSKRPAMGAAASSADVVILTSDNPRSESPERIIDDIRSGCAAQRLIIEPDRERAVGLALRLAEPGDVVLIAGKGHETVQIIGRDRLPCDDAALCRKYLTLRPHLSPAAESSRAIQRSAAACGAPGPLATNPDRSQLTPNPSAFLE